MNRCARTILWVDGGAAFVAGLLGLVLRDWLAGLYGFPLALVLFIAAANLVYASYSGSLAVLASSSGRRVPRRAIDVLVAGNSAWAVVCVGIVVGTFRFASPIGIAIVALEGCFVAALAVAEFRLLRPITASTS